MKRSRDFRLINLDEMIAAEDSKEAQAALMISLGEKFASDSV